MYVCCSFAGSSSVRSFPFVSLEGSQIVCTESKKEKEDEMRSLFLSLSSWEE